MKTFKEKIKERMEEKLKIKLNRSLTENEKGNMETDAGLLNEILMEELEKMQEDIILIKEKIKVK